MDTDVRYTEFGDVEETETGPYCGHCPGKVRHANVASIRACHEIREQQRESAYAEYAAEMANERYYEDRGYWDSYR